MKSLFYCAAAILVASATVAGAQTTVIERDGPAVVTQRIELTPAQRTTIYRTVTRERVQRPPGAVDVRVGGRLPSSIELREMPTTVVNDVPAIRRYRYMVVNNEVVLVDPATSEVIEIIRQ